MFPDDFFQLDNIWMVHFPKWLKTSVSNNMHQKEKTWKLEVEEPKSPWLLSSLCILPMNSISSSFVWSPPNNETSQIKQFV